MPIFLKAAGIGGSLVALIAVIILFFKSAIAFIGFLTMAVKILIVVAFVALLLGVGMMVLRGMSNSRRDRDRHRH